MQLRNAPLVHVIAQVVFSPVLAIAEQVPSIQSKLIARGFPRFSQASFQEIVFTGANPAAAVPRTRWYFSNPSQRSTIVLTDTSLTLHTTEYGDHGPFLDLLRDLTQILRETAPVSLLERIGLRYIDLIRPRDGERFGMYVHEGLLGYPFRESTGLEAVTKGFATQSVAETPLGTLAIRSVVVPAGLPVPPDIESVPIQYPERSLSSESALAVDFDHYTVFATEPLPFDAEVIISRATELHSTLSVAFKTIVTDHAIEVWGPWE